MYFDTEVVEQILNYLDRLADSVRNFEQVIDSLEKDPQNMEMFDKWKSTWETTRKDIPKIQAEIRGQFRNVLGFD